MTHPALQALNKIGQSIWCDNLSRHMLHSGELAEMIDQGVTGLTSNPTIFKQAIAGSHEYDDELRRLLRSGQTPDQACETLMIEDVAAAADLLRPVYDRTGGLDGLASLEVNPLLADDTEKTVQAARSLWQRLGRPNAMIKVPATLAGIPAIRRLLAEGVNVNVTLIFSLEVYKAVVEAFIGAIEERHKEGKPIDRIASVASFFVSRVDSICESSFEKLVKEGRQESDRRALFWGKAGIANSYLAYNHFEQAFWSPRFEPLRAAGARLQRALWASTGTKNPEFKKTLYVDELALPHTVNTLPPATLQAVFKAARFNEVSKEHRRKTAEIIGHLPEVGLDLPALLNELKTAGVKAFADSYNELLAAAGEKSKSV